MSKNTETGPLDRIFGDLGLGPDEALIVEEIMREEIFHSTLDWQSEEQLLGAAIQAHDLYRRNEGFYLASSRHSRAHFELYHLKAIGADPAGIEEASRKEAAARIELNRFLEYPVPAIS